MRGRLADLDLLPLLALLPREGFSPDFISPPPGSPLPGIADDIDAIRATSEEQVLKELAIFERIHGPLPAPVEPLRANPRRELDRLADTMAAYWERAVAPYWLRILAVLSADLRYRAAQLAENGAEGLLNNLHPRVSFDGDWLHVEQSWQGSVELDGRGLLLIPAAFISATRVWTIVDVEPWQPAVVYPVRGIALLWQEQQRVPPELEALVGKTRAQILSVLDTPRSTTELAAMLAVTPGGISQHLKVLTGARLVEREREGKVVLYARTGLGDALVGGG